MLLGLGSGAISDVSLCCALFGLGSPGTAYQGTFTDLDRWRITVHIPIWSHGCFLHNCIRPWRGLSTTGGCAHGWCRKQLLQHFATPSCSFAVMASDLPLRFFEAFVGLRVKLQEAVGDATFFSGADFHYLFDGSPEEAAEIAADLGGDEPDVEQRVLLWTAGLRPVCSIACLSIQRIVCMETQHNQTRNRCNKRLAELCWLSLHACYSFAVRDQHA